MFNKKQIEAILEKYAQDVVIHRDNKKISHKGLLVFDDEKDQRYDFGIVDKQKGMYVYSNLKEDLIGGDILEFSGEEFLISTPQKNYFKNQIVYKKAEIEKI